MSAFAPLLQAFFTDRLANQRRASPHTVAAYRDAFRLLLGFVQHHTGKPPTRLNIEDLDAEVITDFLAHLEHDRANSARTRNARLAALRCFFRFAALRLVDGEDDFGRIKQGDVLECFDIEEVKATL